MHTFLFSRWTNLLRKKNNCIYFKNTLLSINILRFWNIDFCFNDHKRINRTTSFVIQYLRLLYSITPSIIYKFLMCAKYNETNVNQNFFWMWYKIWIIYLFHLWWKLISYKIYVIYYIYIVSLIRCKNEHNSKII